MHIGLRLPMKLVSNFSYRIYIRVEYNGLISSRNEIVTKE
jgi:hypothetical protein